MAKIEQTREKQGFLNRQTAYSKVVAATAHDLRTATSAVQALTIDHTYSTHKPNPA
jgi:hypothetical protein